MIDNLVESLYNRVSYFKNYKLLYWEPINNKYIELGEFITFDDMETYFNNLNKDITAQILKNIYNFKTKHSFIKIEHI